MLEVVAHSTRISRQTAKGDTHKACFKSSASTPSPRASEDAHLPDTPSGSGLKSPKRYSTEPRSVGPYALAHQPASPSSPRKAVASDATSLSPKSPRPKRPSDFSLNEFFSAAPPSPPSPDPNDIAESFSNILKLMSANDSSQSKSMLLKPKATAPTSHDRHPLTPDNTPAKSLKAVTQVRPSSADTTHRQGVATHGQAVSSGTRVAHKSQRAGGNTSKDRAAARYETGVGETHHVAKTEFAKSALVYFCCQDELLVRNEEQAWCQNDCVQVARFVKALPSGDCLVQLLKVESSTGSRDSSNSHGVKVYVSTPYFIECSGAQLHTIQNMKFDANKGKWKWNGLIQSTNSDKAPTSTWKRSLLIDITPSTFAVPAGPRTEPIRKSNSLHPPALTKRTSHNSHFFTEALSRIKCNLVSLEDPMAIVDRTRTQEANAMLCPDFVQTMYDVVGFEATTAPTVFPKVHAEVLLDIPEKKLLTSPTRAKKSNADDVQVT